MSSEILNEIESLFDNKEYLLAQELIEKNKENPNESLVYLGYLVNLKLDNLSAGQLKTTQSFLSILCKPFILW